MDYSTGQMTRRLLRLHDMATADQLERGARWYQNAKDFAAELSRKNPMYSVEQTSAVIAVLSPMVEWKQNALAAARAVRAHRQGLRTIHKYAGFKPNASKALRILDGDMAALKGPKVEVFYEAIMGDPDSCTVDVWIARACRSSELGFAKLFQADEMPNKKERLAMQEALARAGRARNVPAAVMQAQCWTVVRESGVFAKAPSTAKAADRWYDKQNRARIRQGLKIITRPGAWENTPRGLAAALRAAQGFA